ncbi:MAG: nitroreductase family protein [Methyloligellaceae bacterium]
MKKVIDQLNHRFAGQLSLPPDQLKDRSAVEVLANHASCRHYTDQPVSPELVELVCALALAAPAKSDLQQRDIILIEDKDKRQRMNELMRHDWIASAPVFVVFCANNRRQTQIHEWRDKTFANDHLDAFFNASVDAGIVLQNFVIAAQALGLGCCPLSAIRFHLDEVNEMLALPDRVFPVAGMTLGWPAKQSDISLRLPLEATLHRNRYHEEEMESHIDNYDRHRSEIQPSTRQRYASEFGEVDNYGWSEDKARQYAKPERADFGAYIVKKGFRLE